MRVRDRLAVALVAVACLVGAMWLLLVSPERSQVTSLNSQVASERGALASAESQVAAARDAADGYVGHLRQIDQVMRAVPQTPGEAQIVATIDKLTGTQVEPDFRELDIGGSSGTPDGPVSVQLSFTYWTTYIGLQNFLAALDKLTATDGTNVSANGRLFTVLSVSLGALNEPAQAPSNVTKASITVQAYLQPGATTTSPSTGATGATGATGTTGAVTG